MRNPTTTEKIRPHVFVVIPVFNRRERTGECLQCLAQQSDKNFTTIVVDDGSSDGTSKLLEEDFSYVTVLRGDGNLWWTGATKWGVEYALGKCKAGDCIVLLNDDLLVEADYIERLVDLALSHPRTLIGSVVLDSKERDLIRRGGTKINWYNARWDEINQGKNRSAFPDDYVQSVSTLTGRGVLVPSQAFRDVGLHNNRHFPQHGDTEFTIRAARAGYKLIVHYGSKVHCHFGAEGDINGTKLRLRDVWQIFTDQRSYLNLCERFWFAIDTRLNPLQAAAYLLLDTLRVLKHVGTRLL